MSKQIEAMKLALEALTHLQPTALTSFYTIGDRDKAITALREALAEQPVPAQEPVALRLPKIGDEVVCIEDGSLGTVVYSIAGGSPEIKFDDGSHGIYLLREFAELFRYTTPHPAQPLTYEQQDAARYRWLKPRMMGADFDWNESGACALVFEWPRDVQIGADCDRNIDSAIEAAVLANNGITKGGAA